MTKKFKEKEFNTHWNDQAEFWTEKIRSGKDVFRDLFSLPAFLDFIGNIQNKKVLDVGCGEGYNTRKFAEKGAKIIGCDVSPKMIHFAEKEEKKTTRH